MFVRPHLNKIKLKDLEGAAQVGALESTKLWDPSTTKEKQTNMHSGRLTDRCSK
jgi:hypothetical protein